MPDKTKVVVVVTSVALAVAIIIGALVISGSRGNTAPERPVSHAELEKATGRDGNECLVAVDGTVYRIEGFDLWQNGEHTSSEGQAYCGADMSDVIDESPHGRSKLQLLEKVGPLEN